MKELVIDIKRTGFPVKIAGIEFFFDASVEGVEVYQENYDKILERINAVEETGELVEDRKKVVKMAYDGILGEGTFDKLYDKYPDVLALLDAFFVVVAGIDERVQDFIKEQTDDADELLKMYEDKKAQMKG